MILFARAQHHAGQHVRVSRSDNRTTCACASRRGWLRAVLALLRQ